MSDLRNAIAQSRLDIAELVEELGAAALHLREAADSTSDEWARGSVEEASITLGRLERMASDLSSKLAKHGDANL